MKIKGLSSDTLSWKWEKRRNYGFIKFSQWKSQFFGFPFSGPVCGGEGIERGKNSRGHKNIPNFIEIYFYDSINFHFRKFSPQATKLLNSSLPESIFPFSLGRRPRVHTEICFYSTRTFALYRLFASLFAHIQLTLLSPPDFLGPQRANPAPSKGSVTFLNEEINLSWHSLPFLPLW